MALTVRAIYESGSLRLLDEVELDEGQIVSVQIQKQPEIEQKLSELNALLEEEEYPGEQQETFNYLKENLDKDRPSDRKLFS